MSGGSALTPASRGGGPIQVGSAGSSSSGSPGGQRMQIMSFDPNAASSGDDIPSDESASPTFVSPSVSPVVPRDRRPSEGAPEENVLAFNDADSSDDGSSSGDGGNAHNVQGAGESSEDGSSSGNERVDAFGRPVAAPAAPKRRTAIESDSDGISVEEC